MDIILDALKCAECGQTLGRPMILSCGDSICLKHIEEFSTKSRESRECQIKCPICNASCATDSESIMPNKIAEKIISTRIDKFNFGADYSTAAVSSKRLKSRLAEMDSLLSAPFAYIEASVGDVRNMLVQRSDSIRQRVDTYLETLTKKVDQYEHECKKFAETKEFKDKSNELISDLDTFRNDLDGVLNELNVLDSSETKWRLVSQQSENVMYSLSQKINDYKSLLLMNKINEYEHIPLEFDDICVTKPGYGFNEFSSSTILDSDQTLKLIELCKWPQGHTWKLLYRATRDGFTAESFHSKCDNYANTLVVVKSANGNIFGGYANVAWECKVVSKADTNAFLFSLVNKDNEPIRMNVREGASKHAVRCWTTRGPAFGQGMDLALLDMESLHGNYSNLGYTYEHPKYRTVTEANSFLAGSCMFAVLEIEVFQILNK